ncbi:MAG: HPr family phosphocarrier protein [Clostridia bacterium]|nr:HPr family phosphocarrier protein [Clostridia bacterium]
MRSFMYTIKAPVGMHARHAGLLVKQTSQYRSDITLSKGGRSANAKGILALMGLGVKQGDVVTVTVEGEDEDAAAVELKHYMWLNF